MPSLPPPPPLFQEKKAKILAQLSLPPDEYTDLSPKGTVDVGLLDVIDEVNATEGFVTTSSCAGRASVFLEGSRVRKEGVTEGTVASAGGKGGGGTWLYVSHDPFEGGSAGRDWESAFGVKVAVAEEGLDVNDDEKRFIHFKFEPMVRASFMIKASCRCLLTTLLRWGPGIQANMLQILHVLTASLEHAQALLRCAQQAGFRESGIINVTSAPGEPEITPIVGIRTMGLGFESLIGFQQSGRREAMVAPVYLETLVDIANTRFVENQKRIERLRLAFKRIVIDGKSGQSRPEGWEDAEERRARKRAEGLRRKAELEGSKGEEAEARLDDESGADMLGSLGI